MFELAIHRENEIMEKLMVDKHSENVILNNLVKGDPKKRSLFVIETIFFQAQSHYLGRRGTSSEFLYKKVEEMEKIADDHGIKESQKFVAWGHLFLSSAMRTEGKLKKAIGVMEETIEFYAKSLGDPLHPHLERFYQMMGGLYS